MVRLQTTTRGKHTTKVRTTSSASNGTLERCWRFHLTASINRSSLPCTGKRRIAEYSEGLLTTQNPTVCLGSRGGQRDAFCTLKPEAGSSELGRIAREAPSSLAGPCSLSPPPACHSPECLVKSRGRVNNSPRRKVPSSQSSHPYAADFMTQAPNPWILEVVSANLTEDNYDNVHQAALYKDVPYSSCKNNHIGPTPKYLVYPCTNAFIAINVQICPH